jgi:hypothetical protein
MPMVRKETHPSVRHAFIVNGRKQTVLNGTDAIGQRHEAGRLNGK